MQSFDLIYLHLPVLQYMQFMEDYSEPQPSVFYQMPQSESIYEQRNKRFQEVYGFNDSFSSMDSVHEPVQPPALPPKQRQLVGKLRIMHCGLTIRYSAEKMWLLKWKGVFLS